jgi:hypothetical protein
MKEITIKAYEFDDLSDSAKETARNWWRSCPDDFWSECALDEAVAQGELLGIEFEPKNQKWRNISTGKEGIDTSPCIYWSGFSSQGDGLCFEGSWSADRVKADKVAEGWGDDPATTKIKRIAKEFDRIAKAYPEASFTVKHSGHYYHKYCTDFTVSLGEACDGDGCEPTISQEEWSGVEKDLIEIARDFMEWIYRQLEKEYEYEMSDEHVDELLRINNYLFTEEGKRSTVL